MKKLNTFIIERLTLNKNTQINKYQFFPKNFVQLRETIKQLLNERGLDANLNDIDVSKVTSFYDKDKNLGLFEKLDPHNIDISGWDVSNVVDMTGVFYQCENFNCDLGKWHVNNVETICCMFYECKNFTGEGLDNWKFNKKLYMGPYVFEACKMKTYPQWYRK